MSLPVGSARHLVLALVVGLAAAVGYWRRPVVGTAPPSLPPGQTTVEGAQSAGPDGSARAAIGFRDPAHLAEHFQKHGSEFGVRTAQEYLGLAQRLRDRPVGGDVLEAVRGDGTVTRFDRSSGAFLAFEPNGMIRTFFRPNDGEAYFRRQLSREAGRP